MKLTVTTFFSLIVIASFAQSSNFIEIAVDETIELAPKKVTIQITVDSEDDQRNQLYREEFGHGEYSYDYDEYEYGYDDYDEEDWMYEQMLEDSPKKVTKEMTREYEERAKEREEKRKEKQQREEAFEKKWENHKKVTLNDVQAKIRELKLDSKIVPNFSEGSNDEWEYYDEMEEYGFHPDSLIEVTVSNSEDWKKIQAAISDLPTDKEIGDVIYQTADDQYATVLPKLTEKAKTQAQIMATSINRKLGKIRECTNVYPYTPSKTLMRSYTRQIEKVFENEMSGGTPFESTKKEVIEFIYKFELL